MGDGLPPVRGPDPPRSWPLRLGSAGTDEVVESHRIACSHFDAFRFFTDEARPLNTLSPASHDRPAFEQPACLHAGMDLYKHAFRLSPLVPSELVADCFELARDIRVLDMRAAPYDLSDLGVEPLRSRRPRASRSTPRRSGSSPSAARAARAAVAQCETLLAVRGLADTSARCGPAARSQHESPTGARPDPGSGRPVCRLGTLEVVLKVADGSEPATIAFFGGTLLGG